MKIQLKHKVTGATAIIDNTNQLDFSDIKITTDDPNLLIILTQLLKIPQPVRERIDNVSDEEKKLIRKDHTLATYTDDYLNTIFIPQKSEIFDIKILEE